MLAPLLLCPPVLFFLNRLGLRRCHLPVYSVYFGGTVIACILSCYRGSTLIQCFCLSTYLTIVSNHLLQPHSDANSVKLFGPSKVFQYLLLVKNRLRNGRDNIVAVFLKCKITKKKGLIEYRYALCITYQTHHSTTQPSIYLSGAFYYCCSQVITSNQIQWLYQCSV